MSEYRLAPGWITKAALLASSSYAVENFPASSDYSRLWRVETEGVVTASATPGSLSGLVFEVGGLNTSWNFGLITPARYGWFRDTYPIGGKVTYMTYRINPNSATGAGVGWVTIQGYMRLITGIDAEATDNINDRYLASLVVNFNRGTLIS